MPVRSVTITSIEARRFGDGEENKPDQVRIDHNSTVTLVQRVDEESADVDFRYTASYGGLGILKLEGTARFTGDAEDLVATWQSSNQMPQDVAGDVHNAVMQTCVPQAVQLARDLKLPPPIPLPEIQFQEGEDAGEGSASPEVH